jgi:hypothetical protein
MRCASALIGVLLFGGAMPSQAASVERSIWDTLHLGRADSTTATVVAKAAASSQRDKTLYYLAVAARAVTDTTPQHAEQLKIAFRAALNPQQAIELPRPQTDFPAGFNRERLLTALSGALVAIGDIEFVLDALDEQLKRSDHQDAELLWQVVRIVGGDRAKRILTAPFAFRDGEWFPKRLAEERYFPDWEDLKRFSALIPNAQRTLDNLEKEALAGCGIKPAVAAYFLAHVPAYDAGDQTRIDNVLLRVAKRPETDCFWVRLLAARSLALRGTRDAALWMSLVRSDSENVYFDAAVARFAFAQHERDFAPLALRWLEQPLNWYVEAELASNLSGLMEAELYRDYWDIWQARGSGFFGSMYRSKSEDRVLEPGPVVSWLALRGSKVNPRLLHRLLAASGARAKGTTFQTWLKLAATRPEPNVTWWIFQHVAEPAAIPVLRYQAIEKNRRDVIERYERDIIFFMGKQYTQCCDSTEICLRKRVIADNALRISTQRIDSEKDLTRWLSGTAWIAAMNTDSITLRFDNAALNIAEVRTFDNSIQQWRHLFGCWIKTAKAE